MIKVHHLNESRSRRILWLLEELELPYEIQTYQRIPETREAPPELKSAHPLGKSPVMEDGPVKIAESGAIIEYLCATYGGGRLGRGPADADWPAYIEWIQYAEGSAMLPLVMKVYLAGSADAGAPVHARVESEIRTHLGYCEGAMAGRQFLVGDSLTGADVMISIVLELARRFDRLKDYPNLDAYLDRLQARPANRRGLARANG